VRLATRRSNLFPFSCRRAVPSGVFRSMWSASCILRLDGILVDSMDVQARVWARVAEAAGKQAPIMSKVGNTNFLFFSVHDLVLHLKAVQYRLHPRQGGAHHEQCAWGGQGVMPPDSGR
jgi:hypothetical protein